MHIVRSKNDVLTVMIHFVYRRHPACGHQLQPGDETAHLQDRKGGHRLKPYHPEKGYKHQRHLFLLKLTKMGRPSNFKKR